MSPEQAIVADETTFRTYVVLKLQGIELNCRNLCAAANNSSKLVQSIGKMLLNNILTAVFAVALALLTLHLKNS